jgi:hypothetical protein
MSIAFPPVGKGKIMQFCVSFPIREIREVLGIGVYTAKSVGQIKKVWNFLENRNAVPAGCR